MLDTTWNEWCSTNSAPSVKNLFVGENVEKSERIVVYDQSCYPNYSNKCIWMCLLWTGKQRSVIGFLLGSVFRWAEISLEHWMCFDRLSLPAQTKDPILRLWIFPSLIIVVKLSAVHSVCNWTGAVCYYLPSWNANTVLQEVGAADIDPFTYCLILMADCFLSF